MGVRSFIKEGAEATRVEEGRVGTVALGCPVQVGRARLLLHDLIS